MLSYDQEERQKEDDHVKKKREGSLYPHEKKIKKEEPGDLEGPKKDIMFSCSVSFFSFFLSMEKILSFILFFCVLLSHHPKKTK